MKFGGAFLCCYHIRLDLLPFCLNSFQVALNLNGPIGIPSVIKEEKRTKGTQADDTQFERVAFAFAFLSNFLVKKIDLQSHCQATFRKETAAPHATLRETNSPANV